jgi:putative permease
VYTPVEWFRQRFSDPQILLLTLVLVGGLGVLYLFGSALKPFVASVIIAYLLEGFVRPMERRHVPRVLAVTVVFTVFLLVVLYLVFSLLPLLADQVQRLVRDLPSIIQQVQGLLRTLPERYPGFVEPQYVDSMIASLGNRLQGWGGQIVSLSIAYIPGLATLVVYAILVPFLILFMLKDKALILGWLQGFLPPHQQLAQKVWRDVDRQIGNFIRGKVWEIIIVGVVTYLTFRILGFNYSALMGVITGFSVLIPFIGAAVVTIPVALLGLVQWGPGWDLGYLLIAYGLIQALDGNVLVPLIFSEAVKLHPVAIILAILIFGSIWGFWGVFFAIPLATVVKSILEAVPKLQQVGDPEEAGEGAPTHPA